MKDRMAPSADRQSVGKICTAMHHAYRGLRLFPADHPSARGSIDTLVGSVTSHVTSMGSVHLQIDEMRVLYENEQVYMLIPFRPVRGVASQADSSCEEARDGSPYDADRVHAALSD